MKDTPYGSDESAPELMDFGDWLERMAHSMGSTQREVLEQLISSYWTLTEMSELIEPIDESQAAFSNQIDGALAPFDRSELVSFRTEITERLTELEHQSRAIESQLEDGGTSTTDLRRRMDNEFDHLRRILEYLLMNVDEHRDEIETLNRRLIDVVDRTQADRDQLIQLRQLAMRLGIEEADCGTCGETIDLAMLPTATCPKCRHSLTDLVPGRSFLGIRIGATILRTANQSTDEDAAVESDTGAGSSKESDPRRDSGTPRVITGFEWGQP